VDLKELLADNLDLTWWKEPEIGTDKGGYPGEHDYINGFYNEEFKKYQDKEITLLEIGVYKGASLALWSKYFPHAEIFGLDISDQRVSKYRNLDRVEVGICDAYSLGPEILDEIGNFDIIIDDGPHTIPTLQKCMELYLPKLNDGGVMVLEDVQDPSWFPILMESLPLNLNDSINFECIDLRENLNRYDDLLFVIRK
jgi:methyltransferase family protein